METKEKAAGNEILRIVKKNFEKYKEIGDKTIIQLEDTELNYKPDPDSNSAAIIIKHLSGNMKSRFTDFLTSDGEKPDRIRDAEFEDSALTKEEAAAAWENGWKILFEALNGLKEEDLLKKIKIRNEDHSVIEALIRQSMHSAYHIGQMIYLAKQIKKDGWKTLSIPKGGSEEYNKKKFSD